MNIFYLNFNLKVLKIRVISLRERVRISE